MIGTGARAVAMSLADPWSYTACIPDGSRGTGCFAFKETQTIGTGAAGTCCGIAVEPVPGAFVAVDTGSTSGTPTFAAATTWTAAQGRGTSANQYAKYRSLSAGIQATYMGATNTDSGVIVYGQLAQGSLLSSLNGATLNSVANVSQWYKTVPLRNGVKLTWRPDDIEDMTNYFTDLSTATRYDTAMPQNFLYVIVYGAAAATANLLQVEYIGNFEGIFKQQNFLPGGANIMSNSMSLPAEPGWFENAMNIVDKIPAAVPYLGAVANAVSAVYSGAKQGNLLMNGYGGVTRPRLALGYREL